MRKLRLALLWQLKFFLSSNFCLLFFLKTTVVDCAYFANFFRMFLVVLSEHVQKTTKFKEILLIVFMNMVRTFSAT